MKHLCDYPGCNREPAFPDLRYCDAHLPAWSAGKPAWVTRHVDPTRRVAVKEVTR